MMIFKRRYFVISTLLKNQDIRIRFLTLLIISAGWHCRLTMQKPEEGIRLVMTMIVGIVFGFLIGFSFHNKVLTIPPLH